MLTYVCKKGPDSEKNAPKFYRQTAQLGVPLPLLVYKKRAGLSVCDFNDVALGSPAVFFARFWTVTAQGARDNIETRDFPSPLRKWVWLC